MSALPSAGLAQRTQADTHDFEFGQDHCVAGGRVSMRAGTGALLLRAGKGGKATATQTA